MIFSCCLKLREAANRFPHMPHLKASGFWCNFWWSSKLCLKPNFLSQNEQDRSCWFSFFTQDLSCLFKLHLESDIFPQNLQVKAFVPFSEWTNLWALKVLLWTNTLSHWSHWNRPGCWCSFVCLFNCIAEGNVLKHWLHLNTLGSSCHFSWSFNWDGSLNRLSQIRHLKASGVCINILCLIKS